MHIAQTVKANVPPSNSVPGGRQQSISLIHDNDIRRTGVLFCKWESCENIDESATWRVRGKNTNPNLDVKQKNIEKLETVAHQKMLNNCLLWELKVFVDTKVFMYN